MDSINIGARGIINVAAVFAVVKMGYHMWNIDNIVWENNFQ